MPLFEEGQLVPDLSAPATGNLLFNLADYRGKFVLLYFYPKDNTPGCTQQGLSFAAHFEEFCALNCTIFGVSRDSLRTHENFKAKHQFPFELISDSDETLCQLFGVIKLKNMYGKQVYGIERSSFLINPDGILIRQWRKVKVKEHIRDVIEQLKQ